MATSLNDFSDEIHRGEFHRKQIRSSDSFDKTIADGTTNEIDLASHYNFNPERFRLFRNGSREFPHYNSITQFSDEKDIFKLSPDAGDNMHIESAESVTYTVQYDVQVSVAFSINQPLQDGDVVRIGPYNETDGWFLEQRGSDHADNEVDIIRSRGGTETVLEENVTLPNPITNFSRYECKFNWYNVGHQVWKQTYTENVRQENELFAKTSVDGGRSIDTANINIHWEIEASNSTTGLEMNVGSGSVVTLGQVTNLTRLKQQYEQVTLTGTADTWEPVYALRINPNNENVNAQLSQFEILQYGANDDVEMLVVSVNPNKTDASGFTTPDYHHDYNSAIQTTESVSEVPDATNGTQQDFDSTQKPGGHTIASGVLLTAGGQSDTARNAQRAVQTKKSILSSDVVVFLARSGTLDADIDFNWEVTQNW